MSWQEFERLVDDAESDRELRWVLRHCRSAEDLILAARKLGYRVTRVDLQQAIEEERLEQRVMRLDAQCETISPAEATAWPEVVQKERL